MMNQLVRLTVGPAADSAVRGAGDAFCAGADLKERRPAKQEAAPSEGVEEQAVRLVSGIRIGCEKPVIAGIDGIAIGAGLGYAWSRFGAGRFWMGISMGITFFVMQAMHGVVGLTGMDMGSVWTLIRLFCGGLLAIIASMAR